MASQAELPDRRLVTGAEYDRQLARRASDRRARAAFHELVGRLATPGAALLDFGSGTGTDARYYAARGFDVQAYDVDPDMCDYFAANCRAEMADGRVTLLRGTYADFLRRAAAAHAGVELITANFAPLNLLENLRDLFATFHSLSAPGARVLASVLSPYFIGDLRYRWWWRKLPTLVRDGHYVLDGAQGPLVRRAPSEFATQAAPFFTLEHVYRGSLPGTRRAGSGGSAPGERGAWLPLATCRYMFLLFLRRDTQLAAGRRT